MRRTRFFVTRSLLLPLACLTFLNTALRAQEQQKQIIRPVATAVVNMKQLVAAEKLRPAPTGVKMSFIPNGKAKYTEPTDGLPQPYIPSPIYQNRIQVPSPGPVLNYQAAPDEAVGGGTSGSYTIPPDTYGAVGLDKVMITVNNNYKILNKNTGAQLSLVGMNSFWSALGADATSTFDPRTVYDPYNNRWIVSAVAQGSSVNSRLLFGISQTHDPEGNYTLFAFDPDPSATTVWADYPTMGFNKNWVAISLNMFTISGGTFNDSRLVVLDYPALLAGTATATFVTGIGQSTLHFAETYSSTENTLYGVSHIGSATATYRFHTITGTPAAPVVSIGASNLLRTGGGWLQPSYVTNPAPQTCVSGCPGVLKTLDVGDSRVSGNLVFRNSFLWYSQTVGLPAGTATRMGAQWTKINTSGAYVDGGRVEVPTATNANGEHWYTYPSLAVNSSNDMLMGFSKTESDGYAGAAYAFRYSADAAGTMQDPVVYKDGEDYYDKDFGGARVRWGDYSHTVVDPLDDASFWTIQEYAKLRAAPSVGGSTAKWGTWVAKVSPNACLSAVASGNWNTAGTWGCAAVPDATKHVTIVSGQNVTLDVDPLAATITVNQGGTLTINANRTLSSKLIVYGTLNITGGKLTLGTNDVFLSETATVTGASSTSYFVTNSTGKVSKIIPGGSSFEFPVSANTSSYNGLVIANTAGNPDEVYSVRVSTGVTPTTSNSAACVQRTWNINEMTAGGNPTTLTFKWSGAEHGGSFSAASAPFAYRHNGSTYLLTSNMTTPVLTSGIYSSNTVTTVSSFSPWIVASAGTLPIDIDYFTGTKQADGSHKLDWKATCSGSRASFDLQRSNNGTDFNTLAFTEGDYARCLQPFNHTDISPLNGKNFYRLKVKDENGKISYSRVVLLMNTQAGFDIAAVLPNPASNNAILSISSAVKTTAQMQISDQRGSRLMQKTIQLVPGMNQHNLELSTLPAGTYIITIRSDEGDKKSISFVKQ